MTGGAPVRAEELSNFVAIVLESVGVPDDIAHHTAGYIVDADLYGIHTHGVDMLPAYHAGYVRRELDASARPEVIHEFAAVRVVEGNNGLGFEPSRIAMGGAIESARTFGVGIATVRGSNHFGIAGHWTRQAVSAGMIGFATTNGPPVMGPWGSRDILFCNNPISWGIPADRQPAVIFDVACTASSRGKIRLAAQSGEPIPGGWAIDSEGHATTDPKAALDGVLLPFAEHKGSGFAIVNELLSSSLSAARALTAVPAITPSSHGYHPSWQIGHFFMAVDPGAFGPREDVVERIDSVIEQIRHANPVPGVDSVRVPGEASAERKAAVDSDGIVLPEGVRSKVARFARASGFEETLPADLGAP